jgi:hypothetical protein
MPGGYNILLLLKFCPYLVSVYVIEVHVIALAMELSLAHQYDPVRY